MTTSGHHSSAGSGPDVIQPPEPIAVTPQGTVVGRVHHGPLGPTAVFKGIPYARAERFGLAEPVTAWERALDASTYGPQCPQVPGTLERLLGAGSLPTNENCLSLNVFTPACDEGGRPVLVWIHGGAFLNGGGAMPWYHGSSLARRGDVVVVTCNYRLGALGFTGTDDLGLSDQLAVLRWVARSIEAFGGDPDRVTVFGESAGGTSVLALMAAPAARDLFGAAWAMSPSIPQIRSVDRALDAERALLDAAGVTTRAHLRDMPLSDLLEAQQRILHHDGSALTAFAPTDGGTVLPQGFHSQVARDPRPLVIGTTRDEMHVFTAFDPALADLDDDGLRVRFRRCFGDRADEAITRYRRHRPGAVNGQLVSAMQTDETFRVPARRVIDDRRVLGHDTWSYWFTWITPVFGGLLGACHGLDIPFAFHNLDRPGVQMFTGTGSDRETVADEFATALLNFAREQRPGWEAATRDRIPTRVVDVDAGTIDAPDAELLELWGVGSMQDPPAGSSAS